MKKKKMFEVSLINKAYSRVIRDTTRFYTSDTALEIGFKLAEVEYSFDSGVIVLLNEEDQSLVSRDLTREGAGFIYTLEDDIIEHYGNWAAQLKFEKDGETYISSPVGFSIHNDLYNNRPPKLTDVNTWKNLRAIADGLIADIRSELESVAAKVSEMEVAESERQSAELSRIENENQRNLTSVEEFVKLQDAIGGRNIVPDSDFTNGAGGWVGYYGSLSNVDWFKVEKGEETTPYTKAPEDYTTVSKDDYYSYIKLMNNYKDTMLFGKADKKQEEWITPTLLNGWKQQTSYDDVGYYKDDFGVVHLRGTVLSGEANSNVFTLPPGYRPRKYAFYPVSINPGSRDFGSLYVDFNGSVYSYHTGAGLALDHISFRAER